MKNLSKSSIFKLVALMLLCAVCLALFCACNEDDTQEDATQRDLYLLGIAYSQAEESVDTLDDEKVAFVYLSFSDTGTKIDGASAIWHSEDGEENTWYKTSNTYIDFDGARIFSAVKDAIPQEKLVFEEVEYNRLKVVIRYDTIYKSIKSDGEIAKNGRTYSHYFDVDESLEKQRITLSLTSAKSANWYSALLGAVLLAMVLIGTIYLIAKGKLWQKKKTKE